MRIFSKSKDRENTEERQTRSTGRQSPDLFEEEPEVLTYVPNNTAGNTWQKVLLFYNPTAGNGLFKNNLDLIIAKFQHKHLQVVPVRAAKGLAIEIAMKDMDPIQYRQIVVAGGDGTINVCVNAMIRHNIDLPIALFPSGTANDYASYFRIPTDIDGMVEVATGDKYVEADIGMCNNRAFVNVAAMGALVDVSQKTNTDLKNTLGIMAYYLKGVSELRSLKPIPITLTTSDKTYEENMMFMLVMNGQSAGGFKKMSPESEVNDGKLDVMLFREMSLHELPYMFMRVLRGEHVSHPKILSFSAASLKVESSEEISTDVDGEYGEKMPLEFSVLHKKLKIFTPRKGKEVGNKEE